MQTLHEKIKHTIKNFEKPSFVRVLPLPKKRKLSTIFKKKLKTATSKCFLSMKWWRVKNACDALNSY
jgi:hypothetical protein